jgi:hypothetical protein
MTNLAPLAPFLPLTVAVTARGAVSIDTDTRSIGMSPFSERARFLSLMLGEGSHILDTSDDLDALPFGVADDLYDALA